MRHSQAAPAPDSLAAALLCAAPVMAAVLGGRNLTESLAALWRSRVDLAAATRGAVQDVCYGTLRDYGRGDFFLARLLRKPLKRCEVRALLLLALHRLEARPDEAHTTVNQAVEAAGLMQGGAFKALVNAVLRSYLRRGDALRAAATADDVARLRHPRWWLTRLQTAYPEDWLALLAADNTHPPMTLRVNRRRSAVTAYAQRLAGAGIAARSLGGEALLLDKPVPVDRLPGFTAGEVSVQDFGAQQAARLLDAGDGMRILDACAAPGGKSAHLLELADVALTALDADAARLPRIDENLARLGLQADVHCADCRDLGAWWDGRAYQRILADVPCSASGVVRRHPDIKWLRRDEDIPRFVATQRGILEALWQVLAPGGKLLYATCSVFPDENGCQVSAFAARHEDCMRLPIDGAQVPPLAPALALQLLPRSEHDGFYYALLQKRAR